MKNQTLQKYGRNSRRILHCPAVRPCESISPVTLLSSLISISRKICSYQTKFFPIQRRNAREIIRQVGIFLIFFEELLEINELNRSDSIFLCLSELHFAFQKIEFLLEDCTREGARMYILMKSQFIVNQFRDLIGCIATALDVLPLSSMNLSGEVRELVELVRKQAQKGRFEVHPSDQCALERVILILNQFENRFEPELSLIKRVLDYLSIRKWSDCDKEVRFLDEEISDANDELEINLISGLVGLMCYCRGLIFEELDSQDSDESEAKFSGEMLSCLNPEDFRCPISLDLMMDPVTVSTGQTYDRSSIQKWLKSGNLVCPKTGEKLQTTELVPNAALKKLIDKFCADNGVSISKSGSRNRDISRTIIPASPAAGEAIRFLAEFLAGRLTYGLDEQKNMAAYEIRLLAKSNVYNRSVLIEVGSVPPLLNLLTSTDSTIQENAVAALLKLSKHSKGQKEIVENGGLMLILMVLRNGLKMESRQIAAATIFYLSSVEKYRRLIGRTREIIPSLVDLIRDGSICARKNAMAAIFGLLVHHGNHERVLEAGIVPLLIDLIGSAERADLITDSLAVLASLAEDVDGSIAIMQTSALPLIIGLLKSLNSHAGKEYCTSILLSLCVNCGAQVVGLIAKEPSVMPPLYGLVTGGTSHASKKARALISMLHRFNESSSSSLATSAVPKERNVRVR